MTVACSRLSRGPNANKKSDLYSPLRRSCADAWVALAPAPKKQLKPARVIQPPAPSTLSNLGMYGGPDPLCACAYLPPGTRPRPSWQCGRGGVDGHREQMCGQARSSISGLNSRI